MARLVWSESARKDLDRMREFLARWDRDTALRAIAAIRRSAHRLARFPESGHRVEGAPELRELPIAFGQSGYVILYRLAGSTVVVLAIRHSRESGYAG